MTHLKRQNIKKFWPIARKGTKYLSVTSHEKSKGIPLVVVMREILKFVKNKKELQGLINDKRVLINGKIIRDVKYPVILFDSVSFPDIKKYYQAVLKDKKIGFNEISAKQAETRIYKIIDKRQLPGKKTQVNLSNGKNILSSEKVSVGDFVILNNSDNKIMKTIPLEKGLNIVVIKGKHMGTQGKIKEINEEGKNKIALLNPVDGEEEIKVDIKNLFVTGE
jgi:small subunit ribosomal protein S4e